MIDAIKAAGCLLIVLHHLAFYGPMSDVVAAAWPGVVNWLYDHGRLAVQFLLVCAGFLTAGSMAQYESLALHEAFKLIWQRYLRLAIPLLAALSFTVLVTEWVRPGFEHTSLSAPPDWGQALAHVVLVQHLLDLEALSAGIWYVAIDLQLYAMALGCLVVLRVMAFPWTGGASRPSSGGRPGLGRCPALGALAGAGMCLTVVVESGCRSGRPGRVFLGQLWFGPVGLGGSSASLWGQGHCLGAGFGGPALVLLLVGGVAWWLEPRPRIAVAWGVAALLVLVPDSWLAGEAVSRSRWRPALQWLSGVSYSVFLIHFGVCLAVNAAVTAHWPAGLWANALGMLAALLLSMLLGGWLHRWVERHPPTVWRWWFWVGAFKASVALALLMNPMV